MRASAKLFLVLVGTAGSLASCLLDRHGLHGPPGETSMGGGGAMTTSTTTAAATATSVSATATSSSASSSTSGTGGAAPICGNRVIEAPEECDDGNVAAGDGCSAACTIEPLEACPGLPIALTPAGLTIAGTLVGRSDDLAPSCDSSLLDVVYEVTPSVTGTLVATLKGDYEKSLSVRSICGDGPTSEMACVAGKGDLVVTRWVYAGVKYHVVIDAGPEQFSLDLALSACGDGVAQGLEDCDNAADPTCVGCFKCKGPGELFDGVSRHCYRLLNANNGNKDWKSARDVCLAWGGDLAAVSSVPESDFLKGHFDNVWSGATDQVDECQFKWVNGEPWQPRWRNNEPNNSAGNEDCALFFNTGDMDDRSCNEHHDALCERAPGGGCGDQIVQPGEECDDAITSVGFTCTGCVVQCPAGQIKDPATHHCYEIVTAMSPDWDAAEAACAAKGAYLAAVNSVTENALLQQNLNVSLWLGGKRANPFRWFNTDVSCGFLNWGGGEPNQTVNRDCVLMQPNGSWATAVCNENHGYACEHDN
jgi:cysteine-rich repeat protein